jgi:hypothetical protein
MQQKAALQHSRPKSSFIQAEINGIEEYSYRNFKHIIAVSSIGTTL